MDTKTPNFAQEERCYCLSFLIEVFEERNLSCNGERSINSFGKFSIKRDYTWRRNVVSLGLHELCYSTKLSNKFERHMGGSKKHEQRIHVFKQDVRR